MMPLLNIIRIIIFGFVTGSSFLFASEIPTRLANLEKIHAKNLTDWVSKNSTLHESKIGLRVLHTNGQPRPRMRIENVTRYQSFKIVVRARVSNPGKVGVAWMMTQGMAAPKRKSNYVSASPKDQYQDFALKVTVPKDGRVSDFELILPWGDSVVEKITFAGGHGREQVWDFTSIEATSASASL